MRRTVWWAIALSGAALIGLIFWNALREPEPAPEVPAAPQAQTETPSPLPPSEPEIRHPVPDKVPEKPLPALDTSDSSMRNAITELSGNSDFVETLILQGFVRRVVATVDNLAGPKVASRLLPVKRVGGAFAVSGGEGSYAIAADNAGRYARYLGMMEAIDSGRLTAFYFHYYPLFQQAYRELGYPKGHFNDRLVEVIDHLLAAPELKDPVLLVRPKVLFLYADPELEARSAGQKIMMRMGAGNAARVKKKLREIRAGIAAGPAVAAGGR